MKCFVKGAWGAVVRGGEITSVLQCKWYYFSGMYYVSGCRFKESGCTSVGVCVMRYLSIAVLIHIIILIVLYSAICVVFYIEFLYVYCHFILPLLIFNDTVVFFDIVYISRTCGRTILYWTCFYHVEINIYYYILFYLWEITIQK